MARTKYISVCKCYEKSPGEVLAHLVKWTQGDLGENRVALVILDKIVKDWTGFASFGELVNAVGYKPTIRCYDRKMYKGDAAVDMTLLADAYDLYQALRGDSRRAWGRGDAS